MSRAGRRETKMISDGGIAEDTGGPDIEGGVLLGASALYEGLNKDMESMKLPVAILVGERGTWREIDMS